MKSDIADLLVATLPENVSGLFNPWRQRCPHDSRENGPEARLERLRKHLDCDARLILVGEAPGYQGCRYSGVAFTSERLLGEGVIPRMGTVNHRLSDRRLPFSEPSATIVWRTLYKLGLAEDTILWNAVQLHPFKPEDYWSNRTPTNIELSYGAEALGILQGYYQKARFVAVGNKAADAMNLLQMPFEACIRHPANGGATKFEAGLAELVGKNCGQL